MMIYLLVIFVLILLPTWGIKKFRKNRKANNYEIRQKIMPNGYIVFTNKGIYTTKQNGEKIGMMDYDNINLDLFMLGPSGSASHALSFKVPIDISRVEYEKANPIYQYRMNPLSKKGSIYFFSDLSAGLISGLVLAEYLKYTKLDNTIVTNYPTT